MSWSPSSSVAQVAPTTRARLANRAARRRIDAAAGRDDRRSAEQLEEAARAAGWGDWIDSRRHNVDPRTGELREEAPVIPRSVLACLAEAWSFVTVGEAVEAQVFRCKSWRCPRCSPYATRQLCSVLQDTFIGTAEEVRTWGPRVAPRDCIFLTVTEDRAFHSSAWAAARSCGDRFRELLKRAREDAARELGLSVAEAKRVPCKAVQVWEQHAKADAGGRGQFMHVHAIVYCPAIAELVRRLGEVTFDGKEVPAWGGRLVGLSRRGRSGRARNLGFGVSVALLLGSFEGMAAYLSKLKWLTAEVGGTSGKARQVPTTAPRRFRRLRSSLGFLVRRRPPSIGPRLPLERSWSSASVAGGPGRLVQAIADLALTLRREVDALEIRHAVGLALNEGHAALRAWLHELPEKEPDHLPA